MSPARTPHTHIYRHKLILKMGQTLCSSYGARHARHVVLTYTSQQGEAGKAGVRALLVVLVKAAHESAKVKCIHDNAYTSRCAGKPNAIGARQATLQFVMCHGFMELTYAAHTHTDTK